MRMVINNARICFAKGLWNAEDYEGNGDFKFKVKILLDRNNKQMPDIRKIFQKMAAERWKDKGGAVLKSIENNNQKFCLIDGDNKTDVEGMEGMWIISTSSKVRPSVKNRDGVTDVAEADGVIYSGCYVNLHVEFRTMDHPKFGKGLFCTLRGAQFFRDGDAFSGAPKPASDSEFADLSVEDDEVDVAF